MRSKLWAICGVSLLCGLAAFAPAEDVVAKIDLSKETVGQPPAVAAVQAGQVSTQFTAITANGGNTLTVADKVGDLAGPVLKFDKQDDVNGAPAAVVGIDPIKDGKVRITWKATVASYQKGTRSQAIEPLLTLNLLGGNGLQMFSFFFAEVEGKDGGAFHIATQTDTIGEWKFNQAISFALDLDLDQQTASLKIDDKSVADNVKFANPGPLRFLQFRDGTGLGAVDGKFTGAISEVNVVHNPDAKK